MDLLHDVPEHGEVGSIHLKIKPTDVIPYAAARTVAGTYGIQRTCWHCDTTYLLTLTLVGESATARYYDYDPNEPCPNCT